MIFTFPSFSSGPRAPGKGAAARALEHPSTALALSSALPSGFTLLLSPLPLLGARETARRAVNDASSMGSFGNVVIGVSLAQ